MRKQVLAALIACAMATPALAQTGAQIAVSLDSAVFVERLGHTNDGRIERRIERATTLKRGDRLVLMVEWQAAPRAGSFAVTSPIPRTIAFERASMEGMEGMEVSADGGKSWGRLGTLKVTDPDGTRLASPEDVTHLRWQVSAAEARRGTGRITYSAFVR